MKEIKGVITDFDNTIVETKIFVVNHIRNTCQKLHIELPSPERILKILKTNPRFEDIFSQLFTEKATEVLAAYRETAMDTPYTSLEGAFGFIRKIREGKGEIIIVSNRTNKLAERLIQAGFNQQDFLAIVQPKNLKPDQKAYDEALQLLKERGVNPENVLIIGDSPDDFLACPDKLKGQFYGLLTGPTTAEEFLLCGLPQAQICTDLETLTKMLEI